MKLSERWLREWVNPPLTIKQLAEQLTLAGLEVESITPVIGQFSDVVVGKISSVAPHPDASRLQICQVDIGTKPFLSIVCGAPNARAGINVAVARVNAKLPGNITIKEAKLRGVISQGMLCSNAELGLSNDAAGILELPRDVSIGDDLHDALQLSDHCIDIQLTPNRGDCLSVKGIARELSALTNTPLRGPFLLSKAVDIPDKLPIRVKSSDDCPRYLGRVIRGINPDAKTPLWLSERLRRSGLRTLHPVVDVTNYVLLELGQPLHAFDLAQLTSEIIVRRATDAEKLKVIDGKELSLDKNTLVIADETQIHAIAGVMGGIYSAVSKSTIDIFLESAFFNPESIAGRARHYNLSSESAYRFERGVDPELTLPALERATQLIIEIAGGKVGPIVEINTIFKKPSPIKLRQLRLEKIIGMAFTEKEIEAILTRLGMAFVAYSTKEKYWQVTPPPWRFDISLEVDLIEEIVRIHGYNKIPESSPYSALHFLPSSETTLPLSRLRHLLVDRDYHEAITYSFISPQLQKAINPEETPLTLLNPISSELSVMRCSLWPGLLNAAIENQNRQQLRIRLFEIGLCFKNHDGKVSQTPYLAAIATGDNVPEQWGVPKEPIDFYRVKSDIEALFSLTKRLSKVRFMPGKHPALHPRQSSQIMQGEKLLGHFGALHPALVAKLNLIGPVYLFELQLSEITRLQLPCFRPLSKFPRVRRDISFWIEEDISAETILKQANVNAGPWLHDSYFFDVYQPKKAETERRSLALALLWQHPERTLSDGEVDELLKKVIKSLKQHFAIQLRE
ncbi:MAG: phenylalanine--tRNA ligase subunit beta [Rickettsiella sp.]|nr:phenylalanine--tRNA ligase subunit beta [Rickettsiella sp.]